MADGDSVYVFGERHKLFTQATALRGKINIDLLAVAGPPAADNVTKTLHRLYSRKRGRLHDAGLLAEFALRQPVGLPEDAQECPMPERYAVFAEPHLQGTHQRARSILHQMREAVVGHGLAPVPENDLRARRGLAHLRRTSRPSRADCSMASRTSTVACPQAASCTGALPCTTA